MKIKRQFLSAFNAMQIAALDDFVVLNNGLIFHEYKFNKIASDIFTTNCFYFLAYSGNELIGICPVHIIRNGIVKSLFSSLSSHEIPYGGWICDRTRTDLSTLYNATKPNFNEGITFWTSIFQPIQAYDTSRTTFSTAIIDLKLDENEILTAVISSNTRHNIRRSNKKGVIVSRSENIELFLKLYLSFKKTTNQKSLKENELFLERLFQEYSPENKIFIVKADFNEETISSILCIRNINVCHAYIAGRVAELPKNIYQNELIWWNCIVTAKKLGSRYFDLCVIEPEKLPNIAQFKLGFSKELIPFYCFSKKKISYRILNKAKKFFLHKSTK